MYGLSAVTRDTVTRLTRSSASVNRSRASSRRIQDAPAAASTPCTTRASTTAAPMAVRRSSTSVESRMETEGSQDPLGRREQRNKREGRCAWRCGPSTEVLGSPGLMCRIFRRKAVALRPCNQANTRMAVTRLTRGRRIRLAACANATLPEVTGAITISGPLWASPCAEASTPPG